MFWVPGTHGTEILLPRSGNGWEKLSKTFPFIMKGDNRLNLSMVESRISGLQVLYVDLINIFVMMLNECSFLANDVIKLHSTCFFIA